MGTPKKVVISERWSVTAEEFLDIRLKLRLSQTKIAKLMGIHVNTVRRLEKGLMLPRWAALAIGYLEDHYSPQQTIVKTSSSTSRRLRLPYSSLLQQIQVGNC